MVQKGVFKCALVGRSGTLCHVVIEENSRKPSQTPSFPSEFIRRRDLFWSLCWLFRHTVLLDVVVVPVIRILRFCLLSELIAKLHKRHSDWRLQQRCIFRSFQMKLSRHFPHCTTSLSSTSLIQAPVTLNLLMHPF
ncbi:hypothetical protein L596_025189 [Steinernema carpocapsae]|uniref:Uncharacterized protein n=1 Tax=Steinernema carpocapsae TaxID=34508 RepID=A0A4U5M727_STECR|nr:hypothetical protein L596_025189 [Steinernema carpocapsae]